jgi:Fe-S-cluster-containing hydrogenase component 2
MQKLNIDLGSCVRVSSKFSECSKCKDICPVEGIVFDENIPLVQDSCIDCGGCIGVCPTEAISLSDFDTINFIFDLLKSDEDLISCKSNIPCLGVLSVENLISMAVLGEGKTTLDLGHCESCEIKEPLFQEIKNNIKEANDFLSNLNVDFMIESSYDAFIKDEPKESPNRRDFLKKFSLKGAIETHKEFDKELEKIDKRADIDNATTSKMKEKSLPNKRKLLYMALKRFDEIENVKLPKDTLSFISQKSVDVSCDNCSFCYRLCPTGALSSDNRGSKIDFDALSCVKCHLCHDVCQSDSIHIEDFESDLFFHQKVQNLIKFKQIRCEECGMFFSLFDDSTMCKRCTIEEEEAKSLWGIE